MTAAGKTDMAAFKRRLQRWRVKTARLLLIPRLSEADGQRVRASIAEGAKLDNAYVLMCGLSAGIAMLGLLQSSVAVVIGAMLISPLMGPIAALGIGFASIDGQRIREAAKVIAIGSAIGILTGMLLTWISPIDDATSEILSRTHPNLLDLGIALLSGLAGGYATMLGKGETAIGVAIATALMPPLATVGYGIGTLNASYTLGALLLFLTNLSAIAFAFALIARLSGAASPAKNVTWSPRYTLVLIVTFFGLAVPLAMTMGQLSREVRLRLQARAAIVNAVGADRANVPQLDASWPLLGSPRVRAITVANQYVPDLDDRIRGELQPLFDSEIDLYIQQIVADDVQLRSRAEADAVLDKSIAETPVAEPPPIDMARANLGVPVRSFSSDATKKVLYVEPFAAPGWTLADFRRSEQQLGQSSKGWTIEVIPPLEPELAVRLDGASTRQDAVDPAIAVWALSRWGVHKVTVTAANADEVVELSNALDAQGIAFTIAPGKRGNSAIINVAPPPPLPEEASVP